MSGKLDQSLDDIVGSRRQAGRRQVRRPRPTRAAATAPAGGISKAGRATKGKTQVVQSVMPVASAVKEGKILVSGLPSDVNEPTIKDYFSKSVGPVKRVLLTYGPSGISRGQATVIFHKANSAVEAAKNLNGITVDGTRKIKIEVIVGADKAQAVPAKTLSQRVAQTKSAPNKAQKPGPATNGTKAKNTKKGRAPGRGRNAGRGKPKTADELDAEMTDYFDGNSAGGANGEVAAVTNGTTGAQPAATGDNMDEIM
ncbi:MAG: hypothetical protein M1828_004640 [Chrysothrix sp. TS-e1954]|nr:MAG: hypothetical protein M1828_004640 [Chrysothrix sp. TS-e1954]